MIDGSTRRSAGDSDRSLDDRTARSGHTPSRPGPGPRVGSQMPSSRWTSALLLLLLAACGTDQIQHGHPDADSARLTGAPDGGLADPLLACPPSSAPRAYATYGELVVEQESTLDRERFAAHAQSSAGPDRSRGPSIGCTRDCWVRTLPRGDASVTLDASVTRDASVTLDASLTLDATSVPENRVPTFIVEGTELGPIELSPSRPALSLDSTVIRGGEHLIARTSGGVGGIPAFEVAWVGPAQGNVQTPQLSRLGPSPMSTTAPLSLAWTLTSTGAGTMEVKLFDGRLDTPLEVVCRFPASDGAGAIPVEVTSLLSGRGIQASMTLTTSTSTVVGDAWFQFWANTQIGLGTLEAP